jgi:hypothetical protein
MRHEIAYNWTRFLFDWKFIFSNLPLSALATVPLSRNNSNPCTSLTSPRIVCNAIRVTPVISIVGKAAP